MLHHQRVDMLHHISIINSHKASNYRTQVNIILTRATYNFFPASSTWQELILVQSHTASSEMGKGFLLR